MSKHDNDAADTNGAQKHSEGGKGDKSRSADTETQHSPKSGTGESGASAKGSKDADEHGDPKPGHHRLTEHREQHDPAEKDSEITHERG